MTDTTVLIDTEDRIGSGTVIYSDGHRVLVLTCFHVVNEQKTLHIITPYDDKPITATLEKFDPILDLALLSATYNHRLPVMHIAKTIPDLYSRVYVIASPGGEYGHVSEGFLTSKDDIFFYRITNAFVAPGASGGTVTTGRGELICVPARIHMDHPIVSDCINLPAIRVFLKGYKI
jgi:S1-C subfamily serine protease